MFSVNYIFLMNITYVFAFITIFGVSSVARFPFQTPTHILAFLSFRAPMSPGKAIVLFFLLKFFYCIKKDTYAYINKAISETV